MSGFSFKMLTVISLFSIFTIFPNLAQGSNGLAYDHDKMTVDANCWTWPWSIQKLPDSGYVVAGWMRPDGGDPRIFVTRLTPNLATLWSHSYGASSRVFGYDMQLTHNGSGQHSGFIVVGHSENDPDTLDCQVYVLRLDTSGDSLWAHSYGGPKEEMGFSAKQLSDGGFIVAGLKSRGTAHPDSSDAMLMRLDSAGAQIWMKSYGGSREDVAKDVAVDTNGNFVVVGYSRPATAAPDIWVFKTNDTGLVVWDTCFVTSEGDYGESVCKTSDGEFALVGADFDSNDSLGLRLIKFDTSKNVSWNISFRNHTEQMEYPSDIRQLSNGGFAIVGSTTGFDAIYESFIAKFDSNGGKQSFRQFGGSRAEYAHSVVEDGSKLVVTGWSSSEDNFSADTTVSDPDLWTVKLRSFVCGDADGSGIVTTSDAVYIVNHVFQGGPSPSPIESGDADGDCLITISDAPYIINYIFNSGPAPKCAETCKSMH